MHIQSLGIVRTVYSSIVKDIGRKTFLDFGKKGPDCVCDEMFIEVL